jgi:hypothetical protein
MGICLFCKKEAVFKTKEHIIPESLGNDTEILENVICDKCQNYLGREIEKPTLEKTNLAIWRTYLGIRTKRGKLPSIDLDPPIKRNIPSAHPLIEYGIGFKAWEDGSFSIEVRNPSKKRKIPGSNSVYHLVMTPWHLSILGRFLGKIGLEFLALNDITSALSSDFDEIRSYVRLGPTKHLWPIYCRQRGKIEDLKGPITWDEYGAKQQIDCYSYCMGVNNKGETLFGLSIGTDDMVICLNHSIPKIEYSEVLVGDRLSCVYYADSEWRI